MGNAIYLIAFREALSPELRRTNAVGLPGQAAASLVCKRLSSVSIWSKRLILLAAVILTAFGPRTRLVQAEDWPRWRGPAGNAVSRETSLPVKWSTAENIRWKTAIPGEGYSSPIIWKDRVFLTSAFASGIRRAVHCLDRTTGQIVWSREIPDTDPEVTSAMTGHAAATPATDGQHVVAVFGNAGVVCYTLTGERLWHRKLETFDSELGLASSPVIDGDRVFLACDHDGNRFKSFDSFLIALNLKNGETIWKTDRRDLFRSWSTPILTPGPKPELIVNGQDALRAYDPASGKELWRVGGMAGWVTPSPVFGHGLIFATSGRNGPIMAVRPGGKGDVTQSHVVWQRERDGPYVCSPVLYGDYLYVHSEQGILSCFEARTGKLQYRERLQGRFYASSVAGDGKVYIPNDSGSTFVIRAGPKFEMLACNVLDEYTLASSAVSGGNLFLRTEHLLYCIGSSPER